MSSHPSRRHFMKAASATSLAALLPRGVFGAGAASRKAVVHADQEIGLIRPELHSHFAEHLGSCTYGGIWVGKNSPIPNINGYRRASVEYLKELGVPVLRWPGGCFADDYHWRDGIGPAAQRPKRVNLHWGNYLEDNSFGAHEFVGFCRLIGAEPYFAANVGSGTPREFRDWIEYCNYPKGSALSDERAANGSPDPFRVKYWGVGNELWGCGGNYTPERAAQEFRHFATFARSMAGSRTIPGGTDLYLVGCGPNNDDSRWTRGFMDQLAAGGPQPDGYSMHFYENGNLPPAEFTPQETYRQFNIFSRVEQAIIHQRELLDGYQPDPRRQMGLFLDEWGVWDRMIPAEERTRGRLWMQSTMRSAVAAALGLNAFNRQAGKLYMCNIAQLINVLQSVLLTDGPEGKNCIRTSTYWAFMLFKAHRGKLSVQVEADGNRLLPPVPAGGRAGAAQAEEPPDLSVSASRQGGELVVSLVNPRLDVDMNIECSIRGVPARSARAQFLHDSDLNACNTFDHPDRLGIKPLEAAVEGGVLRLTLPSLSVATVTVQS